MSSTSPLLSAFAVCIGTSAFWLAATFGLIMPPNEALKWVLRSESMDEKLKIISNHDDTKRRFEASIQSLATELDVKSAKLVGAQTQLAATNKRAEQLENENDLLRKHGYVKPRLPESEKDISRDFVLKFFSATEIREPACPFPERMMCMYLTYNSDSGKHQLNLLLYSIDDGISTNKLIAVPGVETTVQNRLFRYHIRVADTGTFWTLDPEGRSITFKVRRVAL